MRNKPIYNILFLLLIATSPIFAGSEYYVDGTRGNDSNDGRSLQTAWKTIGKANTVLKAGDTVYIRAGTFRHSGAGQELIRPLASGQAGNPITYSAYQSETVRLESVIGNGLVSAICAIVPGINYIIVKNLILSGVSYAESGAVGIVSLYGNNNTIENCIIEYPRLEWSNGIELIGDYNKIKFCTIRYCGPGPGDSGAGEGIRIEGGDYNLIENNIIHSCGHNCIELQAGRYNIIRKNSMEGNWWRPIGFGRDGGETEWNLVEDNDIFNACGQSGWGGWVPSIQISANRNIIRRNRIYGVDGWGIEWYADGNNPPLAECMYNKFYHNILYDVARKAGYTNYLMAFIERNGGELLGNTIKSNIFWGNRCGNAIYWDGTNEGEQNFGINSWSAVDPKYVDAANKDFHLQATSPCIDSGAFLTKTRFSGSGTQLPVEDAGYFCDGFGIVEGDLIQLEGQSETARIVKVDYVRNSIAVDRTLTWTSGQGVGLAYSGFGPDIGAHEFVKPIFIRMNASPLSGVIPFPVDFSARVAGDYPPYSFYWDFGDGSSSSEQNPSHTYAKAGSFMAILVVTDSRNNKEMASEKITASALIPVDFSCSPTGLSFGATTSGQKTPEQYFRIIGSGSGMFTWNIVDSTHWLSCSPTSGTNDRKIKVTVDPSGLSPGTYTGIATVFSPEAINPSKSISITLRVTDQDNAPFGYLETPLDGSIVSGSLPISGWALDDVEVTRVEIKRSSAPTDPSDAIGPDGLVFVDNATFVEGARPDVENAYQGYPLNSRAGWGYMMLTNGLPNRGNGSFSIFAYAYDASGHRVEIGRKSILCDNANRVKPFGTIDTPKPGETISGCAYVNFGWALTPPPKTIPEDGSTIGVWVDGVHLGHPVYNQYREDIATQFAEYSNASGAVGYYHLDTTQYQNGVHAIGWTVEDDQGEADGIGSRYFSIDNISLGNSGLNSIRPISSYKEDKMDQLRVRIKEARRGFRHQLNAEKRITKPGIMEICLEEMEPVRIVFEGSSKQADFFFIGWGENEWSDLPVGSTFDREKGIFSWVPTPGFIGKYLLNFAITDGSCMSKPLRLLISIVPKGKLVS